MHFIALVSVALAVSAYAFPRVAFKRDLEYNAGRDPDCDPQTSLSKRNESSLSSPHLRSSL